MTKIYVNTKGKHFKMYLLQMFRDKETGERIVKMNWGRIGREVGNWRKKKRFENYGDAYDYVWDKLHKKRLKGYQAVSLEKYRELVKNKEKMVNEVKV